MKRRSFIKKGTLAGSLFSFGGTMLASEMAKDFFINKHNYNLKYAPHIGMFDAHAGNDVVSQLEFMAEQGFTAFEDNEMKNRPLIEQKRMASAMERLGIEMGVFVAHTIYWKEPNLASGKQDWRDEFLSEIKNSVEVAKRVNAKWMTVVPGMWICV